MAGAFTVVRPGACQNQLETLVIFLVLMGVASMFSGMSSTPSTLTILRVVPQSDKVVQTLCSL